MTRLAIALALCAAPVAAQNWGDYSPPDEWTLEVLSDTYATVTFYNADPPASGYVPEFLSVGDLRVDLHVDITSGPETMTVTPPPGWRAVPEAVSVVDGDIGVVELFRGEFLGM